MSRRCGVCDSEIDTDKCKTLQAKCIFTKTDIIRYICPCCDVIFGPLYLIDMSFPDLMETYNQLYKTYDEGANTDGEVEIAKQIFKSNDGVYLDFGCGRWSTSIGMLRANGYNVFGYEPCIEATGGNGKYVINLEKMKTMMFDGIYSFNVLEHLQHPIEDMKMLRNILKPGARMIHSTPCYQYAYEYSRWHLYFFVGKSIDFLCEKSGLEIETRNPNIISFKVKT